jgi:hypothetical protein
MVHHHPSVSLPFLNPQTLDPAANPLPPLASVEGRSWRSRAADDGGRALASQQATLAWVSSARRARGRGIGSQVAATRGCWRLWAGGAVMGPDLVLVGPEWAAAPTRDDGTGYHVSESV